MDARKAQWPNEAKLEGRKFKAASDKRVVGSKLKWQNEPKIRGS